MTDETTAPEVDYEAQAREQNWVPQEDFRGNKEDWIDAKTFVERGKQINPILRANNERLMRELDKTKHQMEELRTATEEFKKFQKETYEKKAVAIEAELASLREEKKRAISAGDGQKTVDIDDQIDALKEEKAQAVEDAKEKPKAAEAPKPQDPDLDKWVSDNAWYAQDTTMASVTNAEAEKVHRLYPELKGKAFLEQLDKNLDNIFTAEKLGRKTRVKPRSPVEGNTGGKGPPDSANKDFDSLPADAKQAYTRFVKQGIKITKEQYVSDYNSYAS